MNHHDLGTDEVRRVRGAGPRRVLLSAILALASASGCGEERTPVPGSDAGINPDATVLIAHIVDVRKERAYVQVFQAFAIKDTTTAGQQVTCADFPSTFRVDDAQLQPCFPASQPTLRAGCQQQVAADGTQTEAQLTLSVPAEERLLLIVRGVAVSTLEAIAVVRGCVGALQLGHGERRTVTIEPLATMGARCDTDANCERHTQLRCHVDANLPGNSCAKLGCSGNSSCLPGSVCLFDDATQGLCARPCDSAADCEGTGVSPATYGCEGRLGPDGCQKVCIGPDWNTANTCK